MNNSLLLVNILAGLFVVGVLLCIALATYLQIHYNRRMEWERTEFRAEIQELRDSHHKERQELLNRIMSNSYSEYQAYEQAEKNPKPKKETNFVKRQIEINQQMQDDERISEV